MANRKQTPAQRLAYLEGFKAGVQETAPKKKTKPEPIRYVSNDPAEFGRNLEDIAAGRVVVAGPDDYLRRKERALEERLAAVEKKLARKR